ncbi:hypothetical protein EJB05_18991 [Eragrostis curvula]|uniref:Uncharacterized protein n=1 Tax=Eragrostis curvula TaxID=38414 RepID=A0A5J9VNG8_9POAL|nr:hypothetical protein EJB05_18991 [Eragrostis curvula]
MAPRNLWQVYAQLGAFLAPLLRGGLGYKWKENQDRKGTRQMETHPMHNPRCCYMMGSSIS